jgi:hypothetical protein
MTSNVGSFISKYHGLGDGRLTIAGNAVDVAAVQTNFPLLFSKMLW